MSNFYSSSPWSGASDASSQIGDSLRRLAVTMAQKNMMQRFQQQKMALEQQAQQQRGALEQAQMGNQNAEMGLNTAKTQHQQSVDNAARRYQSAIVARSLGPNFMSSGPTMDDANSMMLARELGTRGLVRALGGNIDNPPTATINPGQARVNTMTGAPIGYLPPNPTFHSVPAGGTPYILNNDQANVAGPQTPFAPRQMPRPAVPTYHPGSQYGSPSVFDPNSMTLFPVTDGTNGMGLGSPVHLTNILARAFSSSPQDQQQSQRIRVQGPNGETGTVDSSEQLPDGWKPIQ